ncbi:MAG: Gfo/Idh/MocA family oxidoreductase [Bacteroidia bacterium]|nr:Gfo/Idh/MocA family oxidoreductase [Bacteroidia bacterium]
MINVGIIGYGYWGPNITRNFVSHPGFQVLKVADNRPERREKLKSLYPHIEAVATAEEILHDPGIQAVAIVSPVFTHYQFAREALKAGKHVMVEKPMSRSSMEALDLINLAQSLGKVLMVDHTFLYTGSVEKIKELVDAGEIGKIDYFDATRINLGLFQPDVNVIWDLAAHDLSVINYLTQERPRSVQAIGKAHTSSGQENIAYLILHYESGMIAHINVSWVSPVKVRQMLIGGTRKMIVFNDIEPTEKVKIYDKGFSVKSDEDKDKLLIDYRHGDVYIPKVHMREALAGMVDDFYQSIKSDKEPRSDYHSGLEVVRILEAAELSIKENGREVKLN